MLRPAYSATLEELSQDDSDAYSDYFDTVTRAAAGSTSRSNSANPTSYSTPQPGGRRLGGIQRRRSPRIIPRLVSCLLNLLSNFCTSACATSACATRASELPELKAHVQLLHQLQSLFTAPTTFIVRSRRLEQSLIP